MDSSKQYCTFSLGGLQLGVEVHRVQEVLKYQSMTPVPLAARVVGGLINLRGQIVTAVDLRKRFGLQPAGGDAPPMNVVVRTEDGIASLLVDAIGDVLEVGDDTYECPPPTLRGAVRELVTGVHKLPSGLLLLLDVEAVLDFDASDMARA